MVLSQGEPLGEGRQSFTLGTLCVLTEKIILTNANALQAIEIFLLVLTPRRVFHETAPSPILINVRCRRRSCSLHRLSLNRPGAVHFCSMSATYERTKKR